MPIAIDTETTLISDSEPVPRLVSVAGTDGASVVLLAAHQRDDVLALVRAALADGFIAHNAPFDVFVLLRAFPELLPDVVDAYTHDRIHDTRTREKMIDNTTGRLGYAGPYDLGSVASRRSNIEVDKSDEWRLRYAELLGVEVADWPEAARRYAELDATATLQVFADQAPWFGPMAAAAGIEARGHLALYAQSVRGIATHQGRVEALDAELAATIAELERVLIDAGLARIGGTKKAPKVVRNTKVAAALMEQVAPDSVSLTNTGKVSLSEDALRVAKIPDGHPLDAFRRYGSTSTLRSKNIPPLRAPVVRGRYDEFKATGRTGMSSPNLQNQPREGGFRECLVPRDGYAFVISDWSGAELVTLSQVQVDLFGHSALGDAIRAGRDPHAELGCRLLGIDPSTYDAKNPEHKAKRQLAKAPNFGYPGGLGPKRFCDFAAGAPYNLELTEYDARKLKQVWLETWPEMKLYHEWISSQQGPDERYTMVYPRTGLVRGGCSFTEACNTMFQGLAAAAAKHALWSLWLAGLTPSSPMYGSAQVLFVHDENVTECPVDRADEVLAEQERIMIEAFAAFCPDVPIRVESVITDRYRK